MAFMFENLQVYQKAVDLADQIPLATPTRRGCQPLLTWEATGLKKRSPGKKAQHTAKWARTMAKWLVTYSRRTGARWNLVDFGGRKKAEARGIIDLLAVRKDHRHEKAGLKRGDLLEMVLIQVKGGASPRPTAEDIARVSTVAKHHRAKAVILVEWQRETRLNMFRLKESEWQLVSPDIIFG